MEGGLPPPVRTFLASLLDYREMTGPLTSMASSHRKYSENVCWMIFGKMSSYDTISFNHVTRPDLHRL